MRWVDCCLFVLLSCCPYRGLVKAFLIATRRVKEEGWQSGRTRDEHRASVDFALAASSVLHSFAACYTALQRVAQLGRVHSEAACAQQILRLQRFAQLGRVLHSLAACCTAWPRVAQLGCVLHSFAGCSTAWPCVHSEFRIRSV
jgi:hypothetical protein